MPLSDDDQRRYARMATEYARTLTKPETITDAALSAALEIHHAADLRALPPTDRKEALEILIRVCKRRIESMARVTLAGKASVAARRKTEPEGE